MTRIPLARLTPVVFSLLLVGTASDASITLSDLTPQVTVSVATRVDNQMANDERTSSSHLMYGSSTASTLGASAQVDDGASWPDPCSQGFCGALTSSFAHARGEVNADLGRIRSMSSVQVSDSSSAAQAIVGLGDVLTFGLPSLFIRPQLKLHIDLDSRAGTSAELRGHSEYQFMVSLSRHACDRDEFPDGCNNTVFYFEARDNNGSANDSWFYARDAHSSHLADGVSVPGGGLDIAIDLTDLGGVDVALWTEYDLGIFSRAYSECGARTDQAPDRFCSTDVDASHTVYVGITNLAASTFRYPGLVNQDLGTVPEPAALPLVLAAMGLAAVGTVRPRRRRGL